MKNRRNINNMEIPVSTINRETLNVDFGNLKGKEGLLYHDEYIIITSLDEKPHMLIVAPNSDLSSLPISLKSDVYDCSVLYIHPSNELIADTNEIPQWFYNFKQLKTLKLEGLEIESLSFLEDMTIQNLLIDNCKKIDIDSNIDYLLKVRSLEYFIYDDSSSFLKINELKRKIPSLNIISKSKFEEKAKAGLVNILQ
ncbi:hypothetical protein [Pedobacter nototheniae]|uniref:hypothetical protein n=1 Tax=Pedobacter nototheniae TaxID=2488994 RepID=UPI001038C053|nr:hypothetical protein [Pedobacter nototheniae]